MAAYAALISLMYTIEQIQKHPLPPISLDKNQVDSLSERLIFFQEFLEVYSHGGSEEAGSLESRMADAAYAAEDLVESHVVDQIREEITSTVDLYQGLRRVIQDMDLMMKEVMEMKENVGSLNLLRRNSMPAISSRSSTMEHNIMVGFDEIFPETLLKLIRGEFARRIIPIVGMGGIGKTMFARSIYMDQSIVYHFHILAWATVSQEHNVREILLDILLCLKSQESKKKELSQMSEGELGSRLHKSLSGRRYLVVMDDIWTFEAWQEVRRFLPDNGNGSRIIITTRLSNMASQLADPRYVLEMKLLNEDNSWKILCQTAFGDQKGCPLELEKIGKEIAEGCKGLPLSIVVIGGLLAKSEQTLDYWENIAQNINSFVNLEDDERCTKVLEMSYNHLPVHLKPCFLYMGVFREDIMIRVSSLIKLWMAEGFLKLSGEKSLEVVAEEYLKDLIDRNLVMVLKQGSNGKIKSCVVHDLLRSVALKQAKKEKFFCVTTENTSDIPQDILNGQRRIGIQQKITSWPNVLDAFQPESLARSLICSSMIDSSLVKPRLLRVLKGDEEMPNFSALAATHKQVIESCQLVNSRFLAIDLEHAPFLEFFKSANLLWNLQTLVVHSPEYDNIPTFEIWRMPQLRYVKVTPIELSDPLSSSMDVERDDHLVLENLHSLSKIRNLKFVDDVVRRIPNIKKLSIEYGTFEGQWSSYCLNNLCHLDKLESLVLSFSGPPPESEYITFPCSLKKLRLIGTKLRWEDMATKIGLLTHLEVLKLGQLSIKGRKWETVEGQFCSLKLLKIEDWFSDLEWWTTDSTHFPHLEHIVLEGLSRLREIPPSIGDIPSLLSIELRLCSDSAVVSAKQIREDQEDLGNTSLQVRVVADLMSDLQNSLKSSINFQIENWYVDAFGELNLDDDDEVEEVDSDDEDAAEDIALVESWRQECSGDGGRYADEFRELEPVGGDMEEDNDNNEDAPEAVEGEDSGHKRRRID